MFARMRGAHRIRFGAGAAGALALAVAIVAAGAQVPQRSSAAEPGRPNIVLLTTDDQTVRDMIAMPKTRELVADAGVNFRRSYVSFPLCCPARATLLTGQLAHNHGVLGNNPPLGGYGRLDDSKTLPLWLLRSGYRTIHVGKMPNHYGDGVATPYSYVPPGWSEFYGFRTADPPEVPEPRCNTSRYYGFCLNEDMDGSGPSPALRVYYGSDQYQTDVYGAKAAGRIAAHFASGGGDPLYMQVHFFAPHHPQTPAARHEGSYSGVKLPKTPSFNERDFRDKPRWMRRNVRRLGPGLISKIRSRYQGRLETLLAVDDAVEQITAALGDAGELESTYVIFTSDNGFFQGQHRLHQGKYLPYEPSTRVPLYVRGPGVPAGRSSYELVSNIDIAPTIARMAGAKPLIAQDGRPWLGFAHKPGRRSRRPLLLESARLLGRLPHRRAGARRARNLDMDHTAQIARVVSPPRYRAIRFGRWLLAQYENGNEELYDLARDPNQLNSKLRVRGYWRTRSYLARELRRLAGCRGRGCRLEIRKAPLPRPLRRRG